MEKGGLSKAWGAAAWTGWEVLLNSFLHFAPAGIALGAWVAATLGFTGGTALATGATEVATNMGAPALVY